MNSAHSCERVPRSHPSARRGCAPSSWRSLRFEDREPKLLARIARSADCDVLLFGHTHVPWLLFKIALDGHCLQTYAA